MLKVNLSDHFTYKKIFQASLMPILMLVFVSVYSIVDGLFVANFVGPEAFEGLNLIWPVIMIIGGFGFMLGAGGSALTSKTLGEQKKERASQIFSMIVYFTAILGLAISIVGFFLIEPIAIALGKINDTTTEAMIDNAIIYGQIMMAGQVFYVVQNLFQNFFIVNEKPGLGFLYTFIAGITNMILDALFVWLFDWGVIGAAVATIIAQFVGSILPVIYFIRHKNGLIHLVRTKLEYKPILRSCTNGLSEFVSNISAAVIGLVFNIQLLKYIGQIGIGAFGIVMYIQFIFLSIYIGYTVGVMPIVSYHYGAGNHDEMRNLLKKSLILNFVSGLIMFTLSEALATPLSMMFSSGDKELLDLTIRGMRIYSTSFIFSGMAIYISSFFTSLNNGIISGVISFLRTILAQLVAVLVLPLWMGVDGIWLAVPVSEAFALVVGAAFLIIYKRKYKY